MYIIIFSRVKFIPEWDTQPLKCVCLLGAYVCIHLNVVFFYVLCMGDAAAVLPKDNI